MHTSWVAVAAVVAVALLASAEADISGSAVRAAPRVASTFQVVDSVPNPASLFGYSVAIAGRFIAVGAPYAVVDGIDEAGMVHLFRISPLGRKATARHRVTAESPSKGDMFGFSIAMYDDTVVVGAPGTASVSRGWLRNTVTANVGAAYFFQISAGYPSKLSLVGEFGNDAPHSGQWFGRSVAVGGAVVLVGAPGDNRSGEGAGAVHAYWGLNETTTANGGGLTTKASVPDGLTREDRFGCAVAADGEWVVVGASQWKRSGAVHLAKVDADGQALTYVHVATAPGAPAGAMFGESVSVAGKLVIVGAPQARFAEEEFVGAAYAFAITEVGSLEFLTTLSDPQREADDGFGMAVAAGPDGLVAIGAPRFDRHKGASFIFSCAGAVCEFVPKPAVSHPAEHDACGHSVAVTAGTVVIGCPGKDVGGGVRAGALVVTRLRECGACPDPTCAGHGTCRCGACDCAAPFVGDTCACDPTLPCPADGNGVPCSGHGACDRCGACECASGWSGPACGCTAASCPEDCNGNGACECGVCVCRPGYDPDTNCQCEASARCHEAVDAVGNMVACAGHGDCNCGCECWDGWGGKACNCSTGGCLGTHNCSSHGACVCNECLCDGPFTGSDCSCNPRLPCVAAEGETACSSHGACLCGQFECHLGWSGPACNCSTLSCPSGSNGLVCSGADQGSCTCGACECLDGYSGSACEVYDGAGLAVPLIGMVAVAVTLVAAWWHWRHGDENHGVNNNDGRVESDGCDDVGDNDGSSPSHSDDHHHGDGRDRSARDTVTVSRAALRRFATLKSQCMALTASNVATHFEIERLLGAGSFGAAFAVRCIQRGVCRGERFAMKMMYTFSNAEADHDGRLANEREFSILANLQMHRNVVRYLGSVTQPLPADLVADHLPDSDLVVGQARLDDGTFAHCRFVFLELCQRDLTAHMRGWVNPAPWEAVKYLARDLVDGAAWLLAKGIVHYDLKTDNLLVACNNDGSDRLVICDFGLALHIDPSDGSLAGGATPDDLMFGNSVHRAPEFRQFLIADRHVVASARSIGLDLSMLQRPTVPDLRRQPPFAVGVVLYEMCMKEHPVPYYGTDTLHLIGENDRFWIDDSAVVPLPDHVYPLAFCDTVVGLLRAEPAARLTLDAAARVLHQDLGLTLEATADREVEALLAESTVAGASSLSPDPIAMVGSNAAGPSGEP